jgi:hypothetical protein
VPTLRGQPMKMRTRRRLSPAGEASISGGRSSIPALVAAGPPVAPPSQIRRKVERIDCGGRLIATPHSQGGGVERPNLHNNQLVEGESAKLSHNSGEMLPKTALLG